MAAPTRSAKRGAKKTVGEGDDQREVSVWHPNPLSEPRNRPKKYRTHPGLHASLVPKGYEEHMIIHEGGKKEFPCAVRYPACAETFWGTSGKSSMIRHLQLSKAHKGQTFEDNGDGWLRVVDTLPQEPAKAGKELELKPQSKAQPKLMPKIQPSVLKGPAFPYPPPGTLSQNSGAYQSPYGDYQQRGYQQQQYQPARPPMYHSMFHVQHPQQQQHQMLQPPVDQVQLLQQQVRRLEQQLQQLQQQAQYQPVHAPMYQAYDAQQQQSQQSKPPMYLEQPPCQLGQQLRRAPVHTPYSTAIQNTETHAPPSKRPFPQAHTSHEMAEYGQKKPRLVGAPLLSDHASRGPLREADDKEASAPDSPTRQLFRDMDRRRDDTSDSVPIVFIDNTRIPHGEREGVLQPALGSSAAYKARITKDDRHINSSPYQSKTITGPPPKPNLEKPSLRGRRLAGPADYQKGIYFANVEEIHFCPVRDTRPCHATFLTRDDVLLHIQEVHIRHSAKFADKKDGWLALGGTRGTCMDGRARSGAQSHPAPTPLPNHPVDAIHAQTTAHSSTLETSNATATNTTLPLRVAVARARRHTDRPRYRVTIPEDIFEHGIANPMLYAEENNWGYARVGNVLVVPIDRVVRQVGRYMELEG